MENAEATVAVLEEQQQQLDEIEQLLEASPDDPSLLALKADLLELIAVTAGSSTLEASADSTNEAPETNGVDESSTPQAPSAPETAAEPPLSSWSTVGEGTETGSKRPLDDMDSTALHQGVAASVAASGVDSATQQPTQPPPAKKKKKPSKEFVIPPHLLPADTDSKAEENRKKRAVKALKSQWRAQRKDHEANKKQKSWQDFQTKAKKKSSSSSGGSSMFATSTDAGAKVGVVGGRQMTDFASRKRHK